MGVRDYLEISYIFNILCLGSLGLQDNIKMILKGLGFDDGH